MKAVVAFPTECPPDLLERVAAPEGVEVVHAPYEEPYTRRHARRRGELDETDADRQAVASSPFARAIADADAVFAVDLPTELARLAPRLRWIHAAGAGIDHLRTIDIAPGTVITNSSGVGAGPIAEFVVTRLLSMWRRLPDLDALQREHRWAPLEGRSARGKTITVVGFGAIGREVGRLARVFGMHVIGVRRHPAPDAAADEVVGADELHRVLARADAAVLCVSANETSQSLFDAAAFGALRPGALFCNVSRGSTVDEVALVAALRSGRLAGAAIDVAMTEPLPPESELWEVPNLHISPHCSAITDQGYAAEALALFGANLRRWCTGEPLVNVVSPQP